MVRLLRRILLRLRRSRCACRCCACRDRCPAGRRRPNVRHPGRFRGARGPCRGRDVRGAPCGPSQYGSGHLRRRRRDRAASPTPGCGVAEIPPPLGRSFGAIPGKAAGVAGPVEEAGVAPPEGGASLGPAAGSLPRGAAAAPAERERRPTRHRRFRPAERGLRPGRRTDREASARPRRSRRRPVRRARRSMVRLCAKNDSPQVSHRRASACLES